MADPQGTATFAGLTGIHSGDFTLSSGVTPSACVLYCVPNNNALNSDLFGDLTLRYGSTNLVFRDCMANHHTMEYRQDRDTGYKWRVVVLDRRWRWQYGGVTLEVNDRLSNGEINPDREMTPQDIAVQCFLAMGESNYDVSRMPNHLRPHVIWQRNNPAKALAELCDRVGCTVTLGLDNKVRIYRIGEGDDLPNVASRLHAEFPSHARIRPSAVDVIGPPVAVQMKLQLSPVGLDVDGDTKALNDLSYKPTNGWEYESPEHFLGVSDSARPLAFESVWRWYRVSGMLGTGTSIPGLSLDITDVRQLLPLHTRLLTSSDVVNTYEQPLTPFIDGRFWSRGLSDDDTALGTRYPGAFELLHDQGLVKFEKPTYKHTSASLRTAADVFLTAAFNVRADVTSSHYRYSASLGINNSHNGGSDVYFRDDLLHCIIVSHQTNGNVSGFTNNINDVDLRAYDYLYELSRQYAASEIEDMEYVGFEPISVDGVVRQVHWTWGTGLPAKTRASSNYEHDIYTPGELERRRRERLDAIVETTR